MTLIEIALSCASGLLGTLGVLLGWLGSKALDRVERLERERAELSERLARLETGRFDEKMILLNERLSGIERKLDVLCALQQREHDDNAKE